MLLKVEQEITTFARVRARGVSPVVLCSVGHIRFAVCAERSRDNNLRFLRKCHLDKIWNTGLDIGLVGPVARGASRFENLLWPPKKLTGPPKN